ncbi:MAG: hypothetical protein IJZ23_00740 [Roseburia sp.]|nr:hypothetical protein [Roseburia sp.]
MLIVRDGVEHLQSFDEMNIEKYVEINGEQIPLQFLSDWNHYYTMMNRTKKAELCVGNK